MTGADDWVMRSVLPPSRLREGPGVGQCECRSETATGPLLTPPASGRGTFSNPLQPHVGQLLPEAVHVETELARCKPRALVALVGFAGTGLFEHFGGIGAPDYADPVVVGDDHVAGFDIG